MRKILLAGIAGLGLSLCLVSSSQAGMITFSGLSGSPGDVFTEISENGFTVASSTGVWREGHASSQQTLSIYSNSDSAAIEVTASSGGPFTFHSLHTDDGGIVSGTSTATYQFEGFLNDVSVLLGTGTVSPQRQLNFSPDSTQHLDRLLITINRGTASLFSIDNIHVRFEGSRDSDPVLATSDSDPLTAAGLPEPSTFSLLAIGGIALAGYGYRRRRLQAA